MNGLYIHIPFCKSKCRYCDFASYSGCLDIASTYVDAMCAEMQQYKGMTFDTVYIGGGTPTVLGENLINKIFDNVYGYFDIVKGSEITVEANPATVSAPKAKLLKNLGVNRISLGAQSFCDNELAILGRIHTAAEITETYMCFQNAGFDNISLDLMYGLPGQTMDTLSKSVAGVLKLQPRHISCYGLKIEEGTPFYTMVENGEIHPADDDVCADMYDYIVAELANNGYQRYEISNFSMPGFRSRHNCKYWTCTDYVGIGLGAASCCNGKRYTNCADFDGYLNGYAKSEIIELTENDKMSEFVILGLRLINEGVNKQRFYHRFGRDIYDVFGNEIRRHISNCLLADNGASIALTNDGCYISNYVMSDFLL